MVQPTVKAEHPLRAHVDTYFRFAEEEKNKPYVLTGKQNLGKLVVILQTKCVLCSGFGHVSTDL